MIAAVGEAAAAVGEAAAAVGEAAAALAAVLGGIATAVGLRLAPVVLADDRHRKENFRGRTVIATGGVVLVLPLLIGGALSVAPMIVAPTFAEAEVKVALTMLGAGLVTAALGLVDDVYGDRHAGGLIGHARALLRGTVTTGLLKAGGGAIVGLACAAMLGWRGLWGLLGGAVVALASNASNLFDLRPGRVIKLWVPCTVWLLFSASVRSGALASGRVMVAALLAGVVVFVFAELRETVMLGDVGAGLLGVVLGVAAIAVVDRAGLVVVFGVLLALTLLSEVVSFTKLIEATPPLRWLDRLGRRAPD